jgi:hypothetical protein
MAVSSTRYALFSTRTTFRVLQIGFPFNRIIDQKLELFSSLSVADTVGSQCIRSLFRTCQADSADSAASAALAVEMHVTHRR